MFSSPATNDSIVNFLTFIRTSQTCVLISYDQVKSDFVAIAWGVIFQDIACILLCIQRQLV